MVADGLPLDRLNQFIIFAFLRLGLLCGAWTFIFLVRVYVGKDKSRLRSAKSSPAFVAKPESQAPVLMSTASDCEIP